MAKDERREKGKGREARGGEKRRDLKLESLKRVSRGGTGPA